MMKTLLPPNEDGLLKSLDVASRQEVETLRGCYYLFQNLYDPYQCDARFLPYLAAMYRADFWRDDMPEEQQREMIAHSIRLHRKKGTPWAVETVCRILGADVELWEWWESHDDPYGIKPIDPYKFVIIANAERMMMYGMTALDKSTQGLLIRAIDAYKNTRSQYQLYTRLTLSQQARVVGAMRRPASVQKITSTPPLMREHKADAERFIGGMVSATVPQKLESSSLPGAYQAGVSMKQVGWISAASVKQTHVATEPEFQIKGRFVRVGAVSMTNVHRCSGNTKSEIRMKHDQARVVLISKIIIVRINA